MDSGEWSGAGALSLPLTTFFPWSRTDRNVRVQKIFNGYLRISNENFLDAYENSNSTEFVNLANKVKEAVSPFAVPAVCSGALTLTRAERMLLSSLPDPWAGV